MAGYLRGSPSEHAESYLKFWDGLPKGDRHRLTVEAICVGAKVPTLELMGVTIGAIHARKLQASRLKAVLAHPDVMQATIDSAKLLGPNGVQDRKMLHTMPAIGFLPGPQGSQFQVNLGVLNAPPQQRQLSQGDDGDLDVSEIFPPITGVLEDWNENRRSLLKSENPRVLDKGH